jgi:hypothetical protein
MPIPNYPEKETCVAFLDVSGFKQKVREGIRSAAKFLDKFYRKMYATVGSYNTLNRMNGAQIRSLVVSDCSVIFVDNSGLVEDKIRDIQTVLGFIRQINRNLISKESGLSIMTTCSVDYGKFKYEDRLEFEGIDKEFLLGKPYISAYLDNEKLKRYPGKCRILTDLSTLNADRDEYDSLCQFLSERRRGYRYFYWMINNRDSMKDFDREYWNAFRIGGSQKYAAISEVLQKYVDGVNVNPV